MQSPSSGNTLHCRKLGQVKFNCVKRGRQDCLTASQTDRQAGKLMSISGAHIGAKTEQIKNRACLLHLISTRGINSWAWKTIMHYNN